VAVTNEQEVAEAAPAIKGADVVVDAIFGTGLARAVSGHYATLIDVINDSAAQVIAVDLPSGLAANTGASLGVAVAAHRTVTMAFHKIATAAAPGFAHCGQVRVAEIGIPEALAEGSELWLLEESDVSIRLPQPSPLDYKTRRGHALIIAGSPGKWGAGRLAAMAALRAGAGLVTLVGEERDPRAPDPVMTEPLTAGVDALCKGKAALAVGPGMVTGSVGEAILDDCLQSSLPLVIDADGLNHLAGTVESLQQRSAPIVLTPHPGEAARLLGTTTSDVESDRAAAARELQARSGAVVVLKGARTLVADAETTLVVPTGGPGLATAGTGDVLTGTIVAMLAQGLGATDAALAGAYLHGLAGDLASQSKGRRGVVATDVVAALPSAQHRLRH
jgi:NAD(P)H-hydrate epimerase